MKQWMMSPVGAVCYKTLLKSHNLISKSECVFRRLYQQYTFYDHP